MLAGPAVTGSTAPASASRWGFTTERRSDAWRRSGCSGNTTGGAAPAEAATPHRPFFFCAAAFLGPRRSAVAIVSIAPSQSRLPVFAAAAIPLRKLGGATLLRLSSRASPQAKRTMTWIFYGLLVIANLAAGYALGRWWLRNRAFG